jgi:hypothetical protein
MSICIECKEKEAAYEEGADKAYCENCMYKLDLAWDNEYKEFIPMQQECPDCGGMMTWCTCCEVYSQNCCVDYGTCLCS